MNFALHAAPFSHYEEHPTLWPVADQVVLLHDTLPVGAVASITTLCARASNAPDHEAYLSDTNMNFRW